jgi:hypothetical protein
VGTYIDSAPPSADREQYLSAVVEKKRVDFLSKRAE